MDAEKAVAIVPVIDLSSGKVKPDSESWKSTCQDVRKALEEYGYLEIIYDKLSLEFNNRIFDALEELFQLPEEVKKRNANPKRGPGYKTTHKQLLPIMESTGIANPVNSDECQKFTNLMWPNGDKKDFCEIIESYVKMVSEVEQLLLKMVNESYGIEKQYAESQIKSTTHLLRLMKYKRTSQVDSNVGLVGHTDQTFWTLLHQNHINGLQIRTKGGDWMSYQPSSPSSFVLVVGDVGKAWSNDKLESCYHRVIVESQETRYCIALFTFLSGLIKAPKELVDEDHPWQYKPFEHQKVIDFFDSSNDPNKVHLNMVKLYCGN